MIFKGIGEAIEQLIPVLAVVGLAFTEQWQPFALAQLIEPAPPPGAAFKYAMEIGARH